MRVRQSAVAAGACAAAVSVILSAAPPAGAPSAAGGAPATKAEASLQSLLDAQRVDLPFVPALAAVSCPTERARVKAGSDSTRSVVSRSVIKTTVFHLRALPKPSSYPQATRIPPYEDRTWQVTARLTRYKVESDGDVHMVLKDGSGRKMIGEIPYPACIPSSSRWRSAIVTARRTFGTSFHATTAWHYVNRVVDVRGLGFFDVPHGQTGAAPNGIELHPVVYVHVH